MKLLLLLHNLLSYLGFNIYKVTKNLTTIVIIGKFFRMNECSFIMEGGDEDCE